MGKIRIERLNETHERNLFDCEEERLNTYIHKQAGQDARKSISAVYVAISIDSSQIIGFYTLSATQINVSELPLVIAKTLPRYPYVPAFRIGRLAVNKKHQKLGIGRTLLIDGLIKCFKSEIAGIAVIVDAKNTQANSFYLKYGFIQFPDQPLKLFIPMKVIKNLFSGEK